MRSLSTEEGMSDAPTVISSRIKRHGAVYPLPSIITGPLGTRRTT
jgi:hypothetical protein